MDKNKYSELVKKSKTISNKWRSLPAPQRGEYIRLFGEELRTKKEALASIITKEARKIKTEYLRQNQQNPKILSTDSVINLILKNNTQKKF